MLTRTAVCIGENDGVWDPGYVLGSVMKALGLSTLCLLGALASGCATSGVVDTALHGDLAALKRDVNTSCVKVRALMSLISVSGLWLSPNDPRGSVR